MRQHFRGGIDNSTPDEPSDSHNESRQRVLEYIRSWTVPIQYCTYCNNTLLLSETSQWCCANGTKLHIPWVTSPEVSQLYRRPRFGDSSRMINSLFTTAILYSSDRGHGLDYHYRAGGGPPAMRISGQMYARFMRPTQDCWFVHDPNYDLSRLTPPMRDAARDFREILRSSNNPLANLEIGLEHGVTESVLTLCVEAEQQTLYTVFVGSGCLPPARQAYRVGSGQFVQEDSPIWELMLYPLFHPDCDLGRVWQRGYTSTANRSMTLLDYLKSVMLHEANYWICHRLAHQHVLDTWARNEQQNARVWRSPAIQNRIRAFVEQTHGRTALFSDKLYLPATVPGSFRYQQRFFHDALYIASKLGNPHLFITMTTNTHWPEARHLLRHSECSRSRLDVIARAYNARRQKLLDLLNTPEFLFPGHLGIEYVVHVTEWQLCGLPHLHLACKLRTSVQMRSIHQQLTVMDACISARYPAERGIDYDLVEHFMTHNNPCRVCLKPNPRTQIPECRFHFPKPVSEFSYIDNKGFPIYKRGIHDTRVVPHNLRLLRELGCHCNVEWTHNCGCIAYLYKYLTKGYDVAGVRISDHRDEIAAFRRSRVMSGGEATYRSLGYNVNYRKPGVILCKFSLPHRGTSTDDAARQYLEGDPDLMHQQIRNTLDRPDIHMYHL